MGEITGINPLVLAYLAGIVDADGYITIQRSIHNGARYFGARVGIAGTSSEPHDLAAALWGGKVALYRPKNPAYRPQFQWSRTGKAAGEIIEQLYPFLRVKRRNAELALELQEHVEFGRGDDPFPWFGPDYDPEPAREAMRVEMIGVLSVRRRATLDGREHREFPA